MKYILALIVFLCFSHISYAQYKHSAGIRHSDTEDFTYKHFFKEDQAIEFILSKRKDGIQVTGLYLINKPLEVSFTKKLYWYYGGGAHMGYEFATAREIPLSLAMPQEYMTQVYREAFLATGINAILGVEYRWLAVPITIGIDAKPYLGLRGMDSIDVRFWDTAFSVKYVF